MDIKSGDSALLRESQKRLEKKIAENEMSVIQYWKDRLDKVISMKPEGIAPLQVEMKQISDMMRNRMNILKKELR
jgi:hypothetical protein